MLRWILQSFCEKSIVLAEVANKEATIHLTKSNSCSNRIKKYGCFFFSSALLFAYVSRKWYTKTYGMKNSVKVLCAEEKGDYKDAFETFSETKLNLAVNWINTAPNLKQSEKYLLLCKLETRAPEDLECAFNILRIEINGSEKHIMIVVMQKSESGREDYIYHFLGSTNNPFYKYASTKILYFGSQPCLCNVNEKAKKDIGSFLSCKEV